MVSMLHINGLALAVALLTAAPAYAQSTGPQAQPDHAMSGTDAQTMMNQCAQMRQQMRPGSKLSPDMQRMMTQCDQMDAQMNSPSGNSSGTRQRTR